MGSYRDSLSKLGGVHFSSKERVLRFESVLLSTAAMCVEGEVRLQGSRNRYEGRVEVCRLEQWRTVCNQGWDTNEASVVCRQLGFSRISKTNNAQWDLSMGVHMWW